MYRECFQEQRRCAHYVLRCARIIDDVATQEVLQKVNRQTDRKKAYDGRAGVQAVERANASVHSIVLLLSFKTFN